MRVLSGVLLIGLAFSGQHAAAQSLDPRIDMFPKWVDALDRTRARGLPEQMVALADSIADLPAERQLRAVSRWVQLFPYLDDRTGWGASDYWASPAEFVWRGGDCEDAAIAAYFVLELAGVPVSDRAIAVVQDTRRDLVHAVMQVEIDGQVWVIDQVDPQPRLWHAVDHYSVHYIINDIGWTTAALGTGTMQVAALD